jgi:hypothetical protein
MNLQQQHQLHLQQQSLHMLDTLNHSNRANFQHPHHRQQQDNPMAVSSHSHNMNSQQQQQQQGNTMNVSNHSYVNSSQHSSTSSSMTSLHRKQGT